MSTFGHFALVLAFVLALFGTVSGAYAGIKQSAAWTAVTAQSTILTALCAVLSIIALAYCFLMNDYTLQYVWQFSNRDMLPIYKVSAIWGGMDGSMLLWAVVLAVSTGIVAARSHTLPRRLTPWTLSVLNSSVLFFLIVTVFLTNPFRHLLADFIPADGNGLNPLLQNPLMVIHPPMLYLGFTTFAIPYAFCLGALLSGELTNEWIRLTRRWTLFGWGFLTAGIILGGHWAYVELGWGGFWAWDPVENASFLPWLTGTAYLHSVMVQERKDMLKVWNVWLIVLTYGLTVFGTFLTRSGVVQSVHAFASTDVGWVFLLYLGILITGALYLTWKRRVELRPSRHIESFLSREAAFLINNLLFLGICFTTLLGVLFPILSEWFTGKQIATGMPWYNAVNVPQFLLLVFLMGVGPLIAWRKASFASLRKTFLSPFLSSVVLAVILAWAGVTEFYPVVAYCLSFFVLLTILGELYRGMRAIRAANPQSAGTAAATLVRRHRNRYGGYLVHFGVVIVTIAITSSMAHKIEKEFSLGRGETFEVGRFALTLESFRADRNENYESLAAVTTLRLRGSEAVLGTLAPEKRFYLRSREPTTEVALRVGIREDVYLALAGFDDSQTRATFKIFINPLQVWLWFGGIIMMLGTLLLLVPTRRTQLAEQPADAVRA